MSPIKAEKNIFQLIFVEQSFYFFHKTSLNGRKLIRLSYSKSAYHSKYKRRLILTEDHPILTPFGWQIAGKIKNGDLIITGELCPNNHHMEVIIGTLLGDSSLLSSNRTEHIQSRPYLRIGHCEKQKGWLKLKRMSLKALSPKPIKTQCHKNRYNFCLFSLPTAAYFVDLYKQFYKKNRKIVPRKLIEKYFSPLLLATWFMDDGCASNKQSNDSLSRIATHGFSFDDVLWLSKILTKKGFICYPYCCKLKDKKYWELRFNKRGNEIFCKTISPYILPEMRYKLSISGRNYNRNLWQLGEAGAFVDKAIVEKANEQKRNVYCLDVEGEHNFISNGIICHNCSSINAMGISKAMMEKIFCSQNQIFGRPKFCCTRYGNVISSRGSVIPLFLNQIKNGNPITITDPTMTRFILSLKESVSLVEYALRYSKGGEIFILDVPSVEVGFLAESLVRFFKSKSELKIVGIRPGEKMHETLINETEYVRTTKDKRFLTIHPDRANIRGSGPFPFLKNFRSDNTRKITDYQELIDLLITAGVLTR